MQAWWAEENSLKNKTLLFKNLRLVLCVSLFEVKYININKVCLRCLFDSDFTFLVCMKAKYKYKVNIHLFVLFFPP